MADDRFVKFFIETEVLRAVWADVVNDWLAQSFVGMQSISLLEGIDESSTTVKVDRVKLGGGTWGTSGNIATMSVSPLTVSTYQQGFLAPTPASVTIPSAIQPWDTVVVGTAEGREPMIASAINGPDADGHYSLTVARGPKQVGPHGEVQFPTDVPTAHRTGEIVSVLRYSTPAEQFKQERLQDWLMSKVQARGMKSAVFQSSVKMTLS
jgi:hypothetical protein